MKYLIILFACSVAFMTLVVLDSIEAQVKQFTSFDDFFVHLQKTTNSWIDFVRQIQGLMCPDQPVCGDNKILEKEDVLSTLPAALIVANVSVNLEDVRSYAGVCCQPCFCSDTCWQHDNCCPTKQVLANENMTTEVQAECFVATVRSYNNKAFPATEYINYIYRMTTDCFIDNSNHTLLASCRTPDTTQIDGIIPVTSKTTETTYWNRACAACNHDDNDIIDWIPTVIYKREDPYFGDPSHVGTDFPTTFDYLLAAFSQSRSSIRGDLIYKPPISMEASVCTRKDSIHMDYCETSPDRNNLALQGWMSKACNRFYNPVHGTFQPFMNIFCFICQYKIQPKDKDIACRKSFMKDSEGFFQALLNYKQGEDKSEGDGEGGPIAEDKRCRCTEIYDPYLHLCRPTYCPAGKFYAACKCIDILQNLSGMPVLLKIKVLPRSGPDYPQSDIQIRKLQTSVKRNILSIVDHITVRIVATFQQENSYLVIIEAQSDPGHDTKQTLEPLIQYLDTDKHFEVKVGKLAFSATLTSKIALLEEWNETTAAMAYEARDIEQPIGIFELVYIDDRMKSTMLFTYQPLSRLLYCTQLQLNDTEYFKSSGPIITNASAPLFPIFDYYTITPTQIRVCVDSYLKALNENDKRSGGHLIQELSYELIIPSLALVMMVM